MNSIAGHAGAMGLAVIGAICPQISAAEEFTGASFLKWEEQNQDRYIADSVAMMVILSNDTEHGKSWSDCLYDWYYDDQVSSLEYIKSNIARFEDFHPQLTVYGSVRKKCGRF